MSVESLNHEARTVLPGLRFCGNPQDGLEHLPLPLFDYLVAIMQGQPVPAPEASPAEWNGFLARLAPHWVIPFLYSRIGSLPEEFAPPGDIGDRMRLEFLRSRARAEGVERQLAGLGEAFARADVPLLVLKGPAVAHGAYEHAAARPYSDLDLLVPPDMVVRAREVLTGLGYGLQGTPFETAKLSSHHEDYAPPPDAPSFFHIELHWDLTKVHWPGWEDRLRGLFDRAVDITAGEVTFRALAPVDALMHRALNNAWLHYRDMRLIWIADIDLLARRLAAPADWDTLGERCREWSCRLAMETSLKLAGAWTGLRLPAGFDDFSNWPSAGREHGMWTAITSRHVRTLPYVGLLLRSSGSVGELARTGWSMLLPDPAFMRQYHPPAAGWHLPVAHVRRWWKWTSKRTV